MRVLLDTNVLVRAATRPASPAREISLLLRAGNHTLLSSDYLLTELFRVLTYPRVRAASRISDAESIEFVQSLAAASEIVDPGRSELLLSTAPNDNPIMQAAVVGRADVLCTLDRHFHHPNVQAYCTVKAIRVLSDLELLRLLRDSEPPDRGIE